MPPEHSGIIVGSLFDIYPNATGVVVWILDEDGHPHQLRYPYHPAFFISGDHSALVAADRALQHWPTQTTLTPTSQRELMSGDEIPVVRVAVHNPLTLSSTVRLLTKIPGLSLYNCDIAVAHLFLYETGLFPLARCVVEQVDGNVRSMTATTRSEELEYTVPSLVTLRMRLERSSADPLGTSPTHGHRGLLEVGVEGDTVVLEGADVVDVVNSLNRFLKRYDPDVILTEWGDAFLLPQIRALAARAKIPLALNRDSHAGMRTRRSRSYVTYGQVVYQAGAQMLHGRWHIDLRNSFIFGESEMAGLLDIARLAQLPVQYLARTSTGTAISSMQLARAIRNGILIPWQKSEPEGFKTASQLIVTDKGGLTYQPLVGVFEGVGELDFSSMYPTMMASFNISPETIGCACCPDSSVPEINYTICTRRRGLVPQVLDHLLERRTYYKQRKRETIGNVRAIYDQRQTALKWCLVTCLDGNTMVLHRRDKRWKLAPIRDIVEAYLPGQQWGQEQVEDLAVAGIDRNLCNSVKPVRYVSKVPAPPKMIRIKLRGQELLMTANHRCYVLQDGELQIKRADQLETGDWVPLAASLDGITDAIAPEVDLIETLQRVLPKAEQKRWRVFGRVVRRAVRTPRVSSVEMVSKTMAQVKLLQILGKRLRLKRFTSQLAQYQRLAASSLSFSPVISIEEVIYDRPFVYCFELADEPNAFFAEGGILTGNSFGYLGYRNARFGRIEAHEAVTAYSREMLLRAKEVAEAQGFQMLHALVDSMWLRKAGATRQDYEALAQDVTTATALPIFVEGVYRWIGFLPSKTHPGVGVPNRYLGVFEDNTTKVRGIEVRRSDVPILIEQMQERMLRRMFGCATVAELQVAVPALLRILEEALVRLRAGEVTAPELVLTNTLSQEPHEYVHNTVQAITARTLERSGVTVHPGEPVQYIITDRKAKIPDERVRPYALLGTDWSYDPEAYAEMLLRAAETVLELFGYSMDRLRREVWTRVRANLTLAKSRERSVRTGLDNGY